MTDFEIGITYRRSELHDKYGGQRQGGISTPVNHALIFLFTGASGEEHGYRDGWQTDDLFWYYGEGQRGDMEFAGGNSAIVNHSNNQKSLHLFESLGTGMARYLGEFDCEGHHESQTPDSDGHMRKAIVFELRQV